MSSVEEHVTVVTPFGKNELLAGEQVTGPGVEQGLLAAGVANVATAPHWFGSFDIEIFAGHVIEGGGHANGVQVNATGVMINDQPPNVPAPTANWSETTVFQSPFVLVPLKRLNWPTPSGGPKPRATQIELL